MRALVLLLLTVLASTGCPSKETPGPTRPQVPTVKAPATAMEACKSLLEAAKLDTMSCAPMPKAAVAQQGEHLTDGACLGPSDQDCRALVLLYDSVQSHAAVEKLEADSATRVVQNAKAGVTVRIIDASLDRVLDTLQARVSSWVR